MLVGVWDVSLVPILSVSSSTPKIARLVARSELKISKEPVLSRPVRGSLIRVIAGGFPQGGSGEGEDARSREESRSSQGAGGRLGSDMSESDTPHEREEMK